jgi:hypothetical protein
MNKAGWFCVGFCVDGGDERGGAARIGLEEPIHALSRCCGE